MAEFVGSSPVTWYADLWPGRWPNNWVTPWRPPPHRTRTPSARKQGASAWRTCFRAWPKSTHGPQLHPLMVSAFDFISRSAMLEGLLRVEGGRSVLPFVRVLRDTFWVPLGGCNGNRPHHPLRRAVSRVVPSCHSCSQLDSTRLWKLSDPSWEMANICSLSSMTFAQPRCQIGSALCMLIWVTSWGRERTSTSLKARWKCGIKLACDLPSKNERPQGTCVARVWCAHWATRHQGSCFSSGSPRFRSSTFEQRARGTPATLKQDPSLCRCAVCLALSGALRASSGQLPDQSSQTRSSWGVCSEPWQRFVVVSGPDSGDWPRAVRSRDAGCCDTSLGVGRFGAKKRCTHKPVSFLGQLGGCYPDGGRAPPRSCFSVGSSLGRQPRPSQLGSGWARGKGIVRDSGLGTSFLAFTLVWCGTGIRTRHAATRLAARSLVTHRRVLPECVVHQVAWQY